MASRSNNHKLWAYKHHDGLIDIESIRWSKSEVVIWAENNFGKPWRQIRYYGNKAVKVELKEVDNG